MSQLPAEFQLKYAYNITKQRSKVIIIINGWREKIISFPCLFWLTKARNVIIKCLLDALRMSKNLHAFGNQPPTIRIQIFNNKNINIFPVSYADMNEEGSFLTCEWNVYKYYYKRATNEYKMRLNGFWMKFWSEHENNNSSNDTILCSNESKGNANGFSGNRQDFPISNRLKAFKPEDDS